MTYAWFDNGRGRQTYRRVRDGEGPQRSSLPTPNVVRAFSEPIQSQADGKWYDNPRDLARSHRADGNPQGVEYIELGNERPGFTEFHFDEKERRDDIRRSLHDVVNGNVSPDIAAIE